MPFRETLSMAWQALRASGLRSALTLVGMAIGVFSVIASVTAVAVLEETLVANLADLGSGTFTVSRMPENRPATDEERGRRALPYRQAVRLRERAGLPASVSASLTRFGRQVRFENDQTDPNVTGTGAEPGFVENNGLEVATGRFITGEDVRTARPVVVLGSTVEERLFEGRQAVGREVRIDGTRYQVVGTLAEESGGFGFSDPNNRIVIPITRLIEAYGMADEDVEIDVRAPTPELLAATRDEVIGQMRAIRGLTPEAENDFEVSSSQALADGFRSFSQALALGGAGVGLIALLAAGVGVMNVMLVSVTERTREIGIRKALGARRQDILRQFLVEAVVLCQVGGLIGIGLGVLGGNMLAAVLRSAPAFPWGWALIALAGVTVVALTFGVYPAVKASRLRPIEALRYE